MKVSVSCILLFIIHSSLALRVRNPRDDSSILRGLREPRPRSGNDDNMIVKTLSGSVRGVRKTALTETVDVFLGIPYAQPPLGDLRFKKPVANDPWKNVLNGQKLPNSCHQERIETFMEFIGEEMWNPNTPVSEDCLYLNLWVPSKLRDSGNATVLVWFYGGGYTSGTSTLDVYDGSILATTNDVIVASMNYRVGPFGFLYLGTEDAPGNMGLYDQALAMKWIKDNIQFFGGNPESLTLFGESAGAASISLHLISPVSRNLTRRAILQSGSINTPWGYIPAERAKSVALTLIGDVGCNSSLSDVDSAEMMNCMRSVDARSLSMNQWNVKVIMGIPVGPTIDGVFLPKNPEEMLKEGGFPKAEILIGTNKDEGTFFLLYDFLQYFNKDVPSVLSRDNFLKIIDSIFDSSSKLEREGIILQYTDWDHIMTKNGSVLNTKRIGELAGDYLVTCPVNHFAQTFSEHGSSVYYYHFTHRSSSNPWGQWMGVMHADEIEYVFGRPLNSSLNFTTKEQDLSRRMMNFFANFAKTGKPTSDGTLAWPRYSSQEPRYFIFNSEVSGLGHGPRAMQCAFWNNYIPQIKSSYQQKCNNSSSV